MIYLAFFMISINIENEGEEIKRDSVESGPDEPKGDIRPLYVHWVLKSSSSKLLYGDHSDCSISHASKVKPIGVAVAQASLLHKGD